MAKIFMSGLVFAASSLLAAVELAPSQLDFGVRPQHAVLKADIIVSNTSALPLDILDLQSDCGCTLATTSSKHLAPHEKAVLQVEVKTLEARGELRRQVVITTSQGRYVVPIRANVNPYGKWIVEPQTVSFPQEDSALVQVVDVKLTNPSAAVASVWSPYKWITVSFDAPTSTIHVSRNAGATAGALNGFIKVQTNDTDTPELTVPVFAAVRSGLQISPTPLMLGTTRQGQPKTIRFALSGWVDSAPPRIVIPDGRVELHSVDGDQRYYDLTLPGGQAGLLTTELYLFSSTNLQPEATPLLSAPVILRVLP